MSTENVDIVAWNAKGEAFVCIRSYVAVVRNVGVRKCVSITVDESYVPNVRGNKCANTENAVPVVPHVAVQLSVLMERINNGVFPVPARISVSTKKYVASAWNVEGQRYVSISDENTCASNVPMPPTYVSMVGRRTIAISVRQTPPVSTVNTFSSEINPTVIPIASDATVFFIPMSPAHAVIA